MTPCSPLSFNRRFRGTYLLLMFRGKVSPPSSSKQVTCLQSMVCMWMWIKMQIFYLHKLIICIWNMEQLPGRRPTHQRKWVRCSYINLYDSGGCGAVMFSTLDFSLPNLISPAPVSSSLSRQNLYLLACWFCWTYFITTAVKTLNPKQNNCWTRHFQCGPSRLKESRRLVLPRTSCFLCSHRA
jgi:hypothetical protein